MTRPTVLLVYGGESPEHDVSIMSARNIYAAMDNAKYKVKLCYVDTHGKWWLLDDWPEDVAHHGGVQLVAALGGKSFITIPGNSILHIDVIYPAIHGDTAEDGAIQGLAKLLHIPVVGSDVAAHAAGWNKLWTKQLLEVSGIPIVPYRVYRKGGEMPSFSVCTRELGADVLFVKPTQAGSSIGVSRVTTANEFTQALKLAAKYSDTVLIEKVIVGRELEVAVLGNPPHHKTSDVGEIVPKDGFYSYEEKYAATSQTLVYSHAKLTDVMRKKIRRIAHDTFQILECRGLARVDFLMNEDGVLYVNEINTLPGFTNISQYPKLWHEQGVKYPQLIDKLIHLALQ